jgi:protein-L-isoaspartate(D-aspartate) O-methyltransferase
MNDKNKHFPLSFAALQAKPAARAGTALPIRIATPQTATQNAARAAAVKLGAGPGPGSGSGSGSGPTASPSRAHRDAMARAQLAGVGRAYPLVPALVPDSVRRAMVARVAAQGVSDPQVLAAMEAVPRHLFMEPAMSAQAYVDASLPIGHGQTISQPYIVARMIELMRNGGKLSKVLEIGTGCGYQAAVLARVAQEVYSIERIKPLHELAKTNLRSLRIANLRLHYGDGMLGLPQAAPFDGIILAAAGLEVPQALLEQLAIGGRLVAPVGVGSQHLELVSRVGKTEWVRQMLEGCHFVPLRAGKV